ncbi:hypothetical protein EXE43_13525 [Halorubrum sp. SS5]|uniref:hypothetical protein n=1 Tax=unclassified Halorubrum TaxID=2642239 RepID=UPI0010F78218|nr:MULTISPECIES: hypothetical protein [unclassified Halorubrum]TKX52949.1 hypothetical protein EXE42_14860 [Halorubrum sp. SP3]TKX55094.1 hypothetical protein EXE44_16570 [Halorubrum sp. SS7]TKX65063.1 hypothetical protein EXE45_16285 [Halorubrum sp. SP9]TKX85448.1 hypothetical protein EXE43_13525 [Halorubrum sp. SS5]
MIGESQDKLIDKINTRSLQEHLNRQLEIYKHTQVRAERIIQLLIASAAVIATFGDPEVFRRIGELYLDLLTVDVLIEPFVILSPEEQSEVLSFLGVPLSTLLFILGVLLLVDSVVWSVDVIRMPRPRPYMSGKGLGIVNFSREELDYISNLGYNTVGTESERLKSDIKYNVIVLSRVEQYLNRSYTTLAMGLFTLFVSTLPYSAELADDISILTAMLVAIFTSVTMGVLLFIGDLLISGIKKVEVRKRNIPVPEALYRLYRRSAGVNMVHILIYTFGSVILMITYLFSFTVTSIWLVEVGLI